MYELVYEKILGMLICDNMVVVFMVWGDVDVIVVGVDRVVVNGDFVNKIGIYSFAVNAKYYGVFMFIVVLVMMLDFEMVIGVDIYIEEWLGEEVMYLFGKCVAAEGIDVWNLFFDVIFAAFFTGVIMEYGVIEKNVSGLFFVVDFVV